MCTSTSACRRLPLDFPPASSKARQQSSMSASKLDQVGWRPPRLETARLLLRGWEASDAEHVYAYASDPEVTLYMAWDRHTSLQQSHGFLNHWVAGMYERQELTYALCTLAEPQRALGGVGLHWRSREHQVMELGYVLARPHWGLGYVPEAGRALIGFAFQTLAVERIYAPIFSQNGKSRRAAEKMGLRFEGVLRSCLELRGQRWDEAIYSTLRGELSQ
jgi:[ribosomal protein S5]-alanine N-acetyltransferase